MPPPSGDPMGIDLHTFDVEPNTLMEDRLRGDKDPQASSHSGDGDSEDECNKNHKPRKITEKRRVQNAIFNAYVNDKSRNITKESLRAGAKKAKDEDLSIASILAKQQSPTIKDPREYQIELFERAKNENVIAVLDTGSGKTLIAVLLLKHILDTEIQDREQGLPKRISFFLVGCHRFTICYGI
jgi:endoribonuclease Dicer